MAYELLEQIFVLLAARSRDRRVLLQLAQVCKGWYYPALDVYWSQAVVHDATLLGHLERPHVPYCTLYARHPTIIKSLTVQIRLPTISLEELDRLLDHLGHVHTLHIDITHSKELESTIPTLLDTIAIKLHRLRHVAFKCAYTGFNHSWYYNDHTNADTINGGFNGMADRLRAPGLLSYDLSAFAVHARTYRFYRNLVTNTHILSPTLRVLKLATLYAHDKGWAFQAIADANLILLKELVVSNTGRPVQLYQPPEGFLAPSLLDALDNMARVCTRLSRFELYPVPGAQSLPDPCYIQVFALLQVLSKFPHLRTLLLHQTFLEPMSEHPDVPVTMASVQHLTFRGSTRLTRMVEALSWAKWPQLDSLRIADRACTAETVEALLLHMPRLKELSFVYTKKRSPVEEVKSGLIGVPRPLLEQIVLDVGAPRKPWTPAEMDAFAQPIKQACPNARVVLIYQGKHHLS